MCKLIFLCLMVILFGTCCSADVTSKDWDHFVYSVEWPATVCLDSNLSHKHECVIPANVTTWTVHGLWPTYGASQSPEFCNKTAKFDHDKIASIIDEMNMYWPNLYTDSDPDDFWKHEWEKHGTCSMNYAPLNTELKYFQKGLEIRKTFDLLEVMKKGGIPPRDDYTYQYHEVFDVLKDRLQTPTLLCTYDKETQTQYLGEIEFCLNKNFQLMGCGKKYISRRSRVLAKQSLGGSLLTRINSQSNVFTMVQQKSLSQGRLTSIQSCNTKKPVAFPVIHPTSKK